MDTARENTKGLGCRVQALKSREDVAVVLGTGGRGGESGYVNWGSGWADAAEGMRGTMDMVVERARARGGVVFKRGKVKRLVFEEVGAGKKRTVVGAAMDDGGGVRAELTIVAAGAWSGALVDLRGRAEATAQVMAYVPISTQEAEKLSKMPVMLNLSTGMFVVPPVLDPVAGGWVVKVATHSYGYANPTRVAPEGEDIVTSLPAESFARIPLRAEKAHREFLRKTIPWLGERAFSGTRICWYTDTPSGDFLIDYHPGYEGLFLATGGSGHGFKFLPVLGDKIVEAVEGRLEAELAGLWRWREGVSLPFRGTEDGSRGGPRGMVLDEELRKGEQTLSWALD